MRPIIIFTNTQEGRTGEREGEEMERGKVYSSYVTKLGSRRLNSIDTCDEQMLDLLRSVACTRSKNDIVLSLFLLLVALRHLRLAATTATLLVLSPGLDNVVYAQQHSSSLKRNVR